MIECAGESIKEMAAFAVVESTEAIRALMAVVEPSLSSWFPVGVSGNVSGGWDGPQKMQVVENKVRG